jgi:molybdopterin-guanine dinucleotide biosynthesis protein A
MALDGAVLETAGVVLCGGASRRMGRDKARLELGGTSLIARAAQALGGVVARVVLASGAAPRYPELGLECVLDELPEAGPLAGLAAALARFERDGVGHVLVLACDMPRVRPAALAELLARARASGADVVLVATPAGPEPLLGAYHVRVLPAVRAALARGERRMLAFHAGLRVLWVPEAELERGAARNLNTPEEFLAEGGRLA